MDLSHLLDAVNHFHVGYLRNEFYSLIHFPVPYSLLEWSRLVGLCTCGNLCISAPSSH